MYRIIANMQFGDDDVFHAEYSGIYHKTYEEAEKELVEVKMSTIDDETINYVYIEEF